MKTPSNQYFLAFGVFAVTALATFWAMSGSGAFLKSTPYQTLEPAADAELARQTNGAGAAILDGVVARVRAKAETKWGNPVNVAAHDAYLDTYLALVDRLDNETRAKVGPGYAFIFKYLYPRVYALRKTGGTNGTAGTPGVTQWNGQGGGGNTQNASDFYVRYADGAIEFKIDKRYGYQACVMTFSVSKDHYTFNGTEVSGSSNAMEMWLGASNSWGTFIGKRFVGSDDAAFQKYVNLYCSKTLASNGGMRITTGEKIIPSSTVGEIRSNPINARSISQIPWNGVVASSPDTGTPPTSWVAPWSGSASDAIDVTNMTVGWSCQWGWRVRQWAQCFLSVKWIPAGNQSRTIKCPSQMPTQAMIPGIIGGYTYAGPMDATWSCVPKSDGTLEMCQCNYKMNPPTEISGINSFTGTKVWTGNLVRFSWNTTGYTYCFVHGRDDWAAHIGGDITLGPTSFNGVLDAWALDSSTRKFKLFCKDPKYSQYDRSDDDIAISGFPSQATPSPDSSSSPSPAASSQSGSWKVSWYGELVAAGSGSDWFCTAGFCDSERDANNFIDDYVSRNPGIVWPAGTPPPCNIGDTFTKMQIRGASYMNGYPANDSRRIVFSLKYVCSTPWVADSYWYYAWPIKLGNDLVCMNWDTSCPTVSATTSSTTVAAPTLKETVGNLYKCYRGVPWSDGELDWWTQAITDGTHTLAGLKAWLKTESNGANASKSGVCDQ